MPSFSGLSYNAYQSQQTGIRPFDRLQSVSTSLSTSQSQVSRFLLTFWYLRSHSTFFWVYKLVEEQKSQYCVALHRAPCMSPRSSIYDVLTSSSVTAVSIARIESLVRLFYYPPTDPFYDIKITYSIVEPNLAIATACAPALRPLLKHYLPGVFGKLASTDTYGNSTLHTRNKSSHGKMAFVMEPYSQKEFRRDGHAELASIASSQEEMKPKV